jgi:hypothetical protein
MSNRPYGLVVWERSDLPDALANADAFNHFEVLPLDHYTGGAYEIAEQLLERAPPGVAERMVDEAISEGHKVFALVPSIPWTQSAWLRLKP